MPPPPPVVTSSDSEQLVSALRDPDGFPVESKGEDVAMRAGGVTKTLDDMAVLANPRLVGPEDPDPEYRNPSDPSWCRGVLTPLLVQRGSDPSCDHWIVEVLVVERRAGGHQLAQPHVGDEEAAGQVEVLQHPERLRNLSERVVVVVVGVARPAPPSRSGPRRPSKEERLVRRPVAPGGPVKVLRATSATQQAECPHGDSPATPPYCRKAAPVRCSPPGLRPLLLQQQAPPASCVSAKLSAPPRLQSAASSMSARSAGSRTQTGAGVPGGLKTSARRRRPAGFFRASVSAMGIGELWSSLTRRAERRAPPPPEDARSPRPTDSFMALWSVSFSQPDRSRCSRERQPPSAAQLGRGRERDRW
ncbi:hypothetical protein EYF80_046936 [Liparis tanakae]|uniref:Uncharacterized protein n=1 Tax=Liparis tanakae TaxID=230148 RepID=A0A4Z2FPN6_9TELE|nr:hypothetical protein EYF80_046936 [Liparis tanakae]